MRCPICRKETTWKENPNRPFCSERCKLIDLGKWASDDYRIESPKSETEQKYLNPEEIEEHEDL